MTALPRLRPVQVPYGSPASRRIGQQLIRNFDTEGVREVRVAQWTLSWTERSADERPNQMVWTLMVGYPAPWPDHGDLINPWWLYVLPDCSNAGDLAEAGRRILDGGLSVERLLRCLQHEEAPTCSEQDRQLRPWVAVGAPLLARFRYHDQHHQRMLTLIQAVDALNSDQARETAIALAPDWTGSVCELIETAVTIGGEAL